MHMLMSESFHFLMHTHSFTHTHTNTPSQVPVSWQPHAHPPPLTLNTSPVADIPSTGSPATLNSPHLASPIIQVRTWNQPGNQVRGKAKSPLLPLNEALQL